MIRSAATHQTSRLARAVVVFVAVIPGFFAAQGASVDAQQTRAVTIEADGGGFTELKPVAIAAAARHRAGPTDPRPTAGPTVGALRASVVPMVPGSSGPGTVVEVADDGLHGPALGAPAVGRAPPLSLH